MNAKKIRIFSRILICLTVGWSVLCLPQGKAEDRLEKVAATIPPLADMVKNLSGGEFQVITLLPSNVNPHTFEMTPKMIKELQGVKVIFKIGHGLDDWIDRVHDHLPHTRIVVVDQGITLIGSKNETDPHYWLSIQNGIIISETIAETFEAMNPERAENHRDRLAAYHAELEQTDRVLRDLISPVSQTKIVTFHNGWQYFARDYGFQVVATVEGGHESQATPKHLVELSKAISKYAIRDLFIEPLVSRSLAERVARDLDVRLHVLDPFGVNSEGSYTGLMLANARVLSEVLRNE